MRRTLRARDDWFKSSTKSVPKQITLLGETAKTRPGGSRSSDISVQMEMFTVQKASKLTEVVEPSVDFSIYGHVAEVGFVVRELDRVVDHWEKLGLKDIRRIGIQRIPGTYHGQNSLLTLKMAQGSVGSVRINWIEPVQGSSDFDAFLKRHGDGVHHLGYRVKSPQELERQVEHFRSKNVAVLMQANEGHGERRSVYLETAKRGAGLTVALTCDPDAVTSAKSIENEEPFNTFAQYAIVARDLRKAGSFYESLGFGRVPVDYVDYSGVPERYYRGLQGKFTIHTNQWRWGTVPYEWIQAEEGPSVFDEYLQKHGEGIHHLAFLVADMDRTLAAMAGKGIEVAQSGGFRYQHRRGRFAYVDTEPYGGVMIEFIWREPDNISKHE